MHEWLQGLKGAIRVYGRKRPLNGSEKKKTGHKECVEVDKERNIVAVDQSDRENHAYNLDKIFDEHPLVGSHDPNEDPTQEEIFMDTKILLDSMFHGRNLSVFACE